MRSNFKNLALILSSLFLLGLASCGDSNDETPNEDNIPIIEEDPVGDIFGDDVTQAIESEEKLVLTSTQVGTKNKNTCIYKSISTYVEEGGTSVSYSSYYVPKGACTDGTYIYTILNAKTGTSKGTGYDVGIIAKFDTSLNVISYTNRSFVWGNKVRLNYFEGYLYVTSTDANDITSYGDSIVYSGGALKFDTNLKLIDDGYTFNLEIDADGYVEYIGNYKEKVAAIYNDNGDRKLYLIEKNSDKYEVKETSIDFYNTPNGRHLNGIQVKENYIYGIYFVNGSCELGVLDWSGNIISFETIDNPDEGTSTNFNYQSILEIHGRLYYTISNWGTYNGFGLYNVKNQYYDENQVMYTVSFDTNGSDKKVRHQIVLSGEDILPVNTEYSYTDKNGKEYEFVLDGWYENPATKFDFETKITHDYVLKAKWTFDDEFFAVKENAEVRAKGTAARIMSFNVLCDDYNNKPPVDDKRANQVFNCIERYLPDVVGLQEFDDEFYAKSDTLLDGYKIVNRSNNKVNGHTNYSTIAYNASTVRLVNYEQIRLTPNDNDNCRNLTKALFEFISGDYEGKQFIVTSNHWNLTDSARVQQAKFVGEYYNSWREQYGYDVPIFMTGDWNSSDIQESYSTLLETADNLYDTKHAEKIGLICDNYHLGNGLAPATIEKATNISYFWTRGRESFLPSNVKSTNTVDHIFADEDVTSLFADTIVDDDALGCSDHAPIYSDLMW